MIYLFTSLKLSTVKNFIPSCHTDLKKKKERISTLKLTHSHELYHKSHNTESLRLERNCGDHQVQPLCSDRVQREQVAQDAVQSGFEYLQGWRLQSLSGQPVPVFTMLTEERGFFLHVWIELLVFQFVSGSVSFLLSCHILHTLTILLETFFLGHISANELKKSLLFLK